MNDPIADACSLASHDIHNGRGKGSMCFSLFDGSKRVYRFATLRNGEHQVRRLDNRLAIAEFAGVIDLDRNARQPLKVILADQSGEIARPTSNDGDLVEPLRRFRTQL